MDNINLNARLKNKIESWTKLIQLEKTRFIKVNELKRIQVELFSFFHFMCAAANVSELFCMAHLENSERFSYHSNLSFLSIKF